MTRKQPKIIVYKEGQQTAREKHDELVFKADTLRKKYDLRYVDSDRVNNIFQRGYINKLKRETEERKQEKEKDV